MLGMCTDYSDPPPDPARLLPTPVQPNTLSDGRGSAHTVWRALTAVVYLPPGSVRGERGECREGLENS